MTTAQIKALAEYVRGGVEAHKDVSPETLTAVNAVASGVDFWVENEAKLTERKVRAYKAVRYGK